MTRKTRILLVDDNEDNLDLLSRRLAKKDFEVVAVDSALDALNCIEEQPAFDLVLLDIMMPVMSGTEALKKIRMQHSSSELPVIMATAKNQSGDIIEALSLGANDYVTKPVDFPVLLARIETQLSLRSAHCEIKQLVRKLEDRNSFIREVFGRFMHDDIVDELLNQPEALKLGGDVKNVSILYADLRDFTASCASLNPQQTVDYLNNYLGVMSKVIEDHRGTVNEFYGDGILAYFGAPVDDTYHALNAVKCAIAMQLEIPKINTTNQQQGLPPIAMGIGINSGDVIVGNVGSEKHTKYGVIGSEVNLAARIESQTMAGQILVSKSTCQATQAHFQYTDAKQISLKGFDQPQLVHEVLVNK